MKKKTIIISSIFFVIILVISFYLIKENWWRTKFDVSKPVFTDNGNTVEFDIYNKTQSDHFIRIYYTIKSGSIKEDGICIYNLLEENPGIYKVEAHTKTTIKCSTWEFDETYDFKIKKITKMVRIKN